MSSLAGFLVAFLLKVLRCTYKFQFSGVEYRELAESTNSKKSYILAFWHQNILASVISQDHRRHVAIVSPSKDGDIAVNIAKHFGYSFVRGSSSKSGGKALLTMIKKISAEGLPGGITVDGPRGPSHIVKPGVIELAKFAKVPILPLLAYPERYWSFNSWDKFRLPMPFSTIHIIYSRPIQIPHDIKKEDYPSYAKQVQDSLEQEEEKIINYLKGRSNV